MRFNPGQNRKVVKGKTYIKDLPQIQLTPVKEVKEVKEEKNESIQHEQVVQNPVSKGSKPVRRKVGSSSKSNRSGNSGS